MNLYCPYCNARVVPNGDQKKVVHEESCRLLNRPTAIFWLIILVSLILGAMIGHQLDVIRGIL